MQSVDDAIRNLQVAYHYSTKRDDAQPIGCVSITVIMKSDFFLDHVQLAMPAGQEARARTFYVNVLGFEETVKPPELAKRGGAWFGSGSVRIHVGVDDAFVPARKAHPALRCTQYDALVERVRSAGIAVVDDPLPFEGKRHCYIADPFGNRIELIEA